MEVVVAENQGRACRVCPRVKKKNIAAPTFRTTIRRQAASLGVPADALERALILGQLAALLAWHPRMRDSVAFKGGAIMRLVDQSPRLSRDLDSAELRGRPIQEKWVREALSTARAKRAVLGVERIVRRSATSLSLAVKR